MPEQKRSEPGFKELPGPETFLAAMTDARTMRALRQSAKIVRRENREAGFGVFLTKKGRIFVTKVRGGSQDSMYPERDEDYEISFWDTIRVVEKKPLDLLGVHFHSAGSYIVPSPDDLKILSGLSVRAGRESDKPTMGIGVVDEKGNIDLCLIRIKTKIAPNGFLVDDFWESLDEVRYLEGLDLLPEEVKQDILRRFNQSLLYKATIVSLAEGVKSFPEWEMTKLRDFFGVANTQSAEVGEVIL